MARARIPGLNVRRVCEVMEEIAPPALAQSWDNVGLLVGDRGADCRCTLLCIDLTPAVLDEAIAEGCDLVVAYHPPIFRPVQRLLADSSETDAIIHRAIAARIAIYSPHTALDAAAGGTNDVMAGLCRLSHVKPFEFVNPGRQQFKVTTFVPEPQLEQVASAMFTAGAGRIGDYEQCSYRLRGEGTFFGSESTSPTVGQRGRLERVEETRLEVVTPSDTLPEVVSALRSAHPYEEPAFDIYPLAAESVAGIGRSGRVPAGTTLQRLALSLRRATRSQVLSVVGEADTAIRQAAVCVGAAGRLPLERPLAADCDVIVTGEIRHHDALAILRRGKTAIALGHWESERPVLDPLSERLRHKLPNLAVTISQRDVPPFRRI